jgi:hypothetical protein
VIRTQAPPLILDVWQRFRGIPAETLTKAWWLHQCGGAPRQRTVSEMRLHRHLHGTGGNCFDLVLWLLAELADADAAARPIGHDLETPRAHIAAVVRHDGAEYLCDPGDQWLQPVLISPDHVAFDASWLAGFFPGAKIRIDPGGEDLRVHYLFPDGHQNVQTYHLGHVDAEALDRACLHSQGLLRKPLVEVVARNRDTGELGAWEFDRFRSLWRLPSGHRVEDPCADLPAWAQRIADRTGMSLAVVMHALQVYAERDGRR